MAKKKNPDDVEIPDALVVAARQIGDTAHRFFVLGELPAFHEYMQNVVKELKSRGWPLGNSNADPLFDMVDNLKWERGSKAQSRHSLNLWLNELSNTKNIRHFFVDPANIATLQAAADAATPPTAKVWGDQTKVREGLRSVTKAVFNAAAEKITNRNSPERLLHKELTGLIATMKTYSAQDVPFIEFQGRVQEYLDKKGWLIAEPDDVHHNLNQRLWSLAAAAQQKSSIPMRYELQYDTFPPRDVFLHPQEFILQNISDIGAAAKEVAAELDKELKADKGLITRHCSIFGREDATDFSWGDARRQQAPQTPVEIQKSITVKGPIKYGK